MSDNDNGQGTIQMRIMPLEPSLNQKAIYRDKDWLSKQCDTLDLTCSEISRKIGCSKHTVETWMKKHDIKKVPLEIIFQKDTEFYVYVVSIENI